MKESFQPAPTIEITEDRESLKSVDPAEYFKSTSFEKKARSIDGDPSHPWDQARNQTFVIENETESFATGYGFDPETKMMNMLAAYKKEDGSTSTILVEGVEFEDTRVLEYVQDFIPCLPDGLRGDFIEKTMAVLPDFKDHPNPSQKFADIFLESIPNIQEFLGDIDTKIFDHITDPDRKTEVQGLLKRISAKMDHGDFKAKLGSFVESLRFRDEAFTRQYESVPVDMLKWITETRPDLKHDYDLVWQPDVKEFTIEDKVERSIHSTDELNDALSTMPMKKGPNTHELKFISSQAELVHLDKVLGGVTIDNWNVSTSPGRGPENILKFAQGFQDGSIPLMGRGDPIKLIEYQGEYFVEGDGRHRTVALKALGVGEIPVLVSHYV